MIADSELQKELLSKFVSHSSRVYYLLQPLLKGPYNQNPANTSATQAHTSQVQAICYYEGPGFYRVWGCTYDTSFNPQVYSCTTIDSNRDVTETIYETQDRQSK